jgi:hypothetical protein
MIIRILAAIGLMVVLGGSVQAKIACEAWCSKCNSTAGCTADCVRRNQPMVNPSCDVTSRISCTAWCQKCKPDAACMNSCSASGNKQVSASCSVRGGG